MKSYILALLAACGLAGPMSVQAGVILQDMQNAAIPVDQFSEPIGQSFTAEDSKISFAFFYSPTGSTSEPLQLELRDGDGVAGSLLDSVIFSLPAITYTGFFDVAFSSTFLTIGQQYTAVLSRPGEITQWLVQVQLRTNPYAGGRAYFGLCNLIICNGPGDDMRFRVTPLIASVPEPAMLALLGVGLIGLGFSRRKRTVDALGGACTH